MAAKSYPTCNTTSSLLQQLDKTHRLSESRQRLSTMDSILMHNRWFFRFLFKSNLFRRNNQAILIKTLMCKCNQGRSQLLIRWWKDLSRDPLDQAQTCNSKSRLLLFPPSLSSKLIKGICLPSKKKANKLCFQTLQ